MQDYVVLKGKDGFTKEFDDDTRNINSKYRYKVRTYHRLPYPTIHTILGEPVKVIDREFVLRSEFDCMGKHVCYYEEI